MNKHIASKFAPVSAGKKDKKQLFGLSVEELKLVTGGGGVIVQNPESEPLVLPPAITAPGAVLLKP